MKRIEYEWWKVERKCACVQKCVCVCVRVRVCDEQKRHSGRKGPPRFVDKIVGFSVCEALDIKMLLRTKRFFTQLLF